MIYCHRILEQRILESVAAEKIIILLGARQTGKSTLLRALLPENSIIFNLQNTQQRFDFSKNPHRLSEILQARPEKELYILIDEIQKVPELLDEIQYLYDKNRTKYRFILTGSSSRQLAKKSANLLPGRSHLYHLYPISQAERGIVGLCSFEKIDTPNFASQSLEDLMLYGSLPGLISESHNIKVKTLESYAELYLEEEIRSENFVKDIGSFINFLQSAAIHSGKPISLTNLSQDVGVAVNTIKNYYQILVDTYVGYYIPAYSGNIRKRLFSTPKFTFFDNGLRNACAKMQFSERLLNTEGGYLFEHWVGTELFHQASMLGAGYSLMYYRTISDAEIDYILETPEEIIPIEVKWTTNPTLKDARHLEAFLDEEKQAKRGYIVCRCSEPLQITSRVQAIPWGKL